MITEVTIKLSLESLRPLDEQTAEQYISELLLGEDDNFFGGETGLYAIALPDIKVEMEEV
ncbi:hypothetical protein [Synechocystis sp. CACIAM 05]|jgi:hypothetical protein|uniref:hypothetical protein n=1 Tax=Synechocystis sp. CACIAM 05 TaxID=1933929 RepID=UPI00138E574C|nr:hypothetical protein [Synechocystis sp. CACIAM 05]QHU99576.1 hypothetical protein BWK47_05155 [Synechocystis sp. CACIAM 05]